MKRITTRVVGVVLCIAMVSSMAAAPAAAQADEDSFLVELDAEGDADITVTFGYDLDSDDEQAAFEELQGNETAQAALAERFENRMGSVASDASASTDREMSVRSASVELERDGDVGLVVLSLEWSNLAAVDGDRLTVTEPFASGFEPDRTFSVVAPDGYEVTSATPEPSSNDGASATWNTHASLDGFELVAETAADSDDEPGADDTDDQAGFGAVATVLALLAASMLALRSRQQ